MTDDPQAAPAAPPPSERRAGIPGRRRADRRPDQPDGAGGEQGRARENLRRAEDRLVRDHVELVRRVVSQVVARVPSHVSRDDLMSAGLTGLALAARQFDPARGVPFERYAVLRIRGALTDELRSYDWASRPVRTRARALATTTESLTARLGRAPTPDELATAANLTPAALRQLSGDLRRASLLNLDALTDGEGEAALSDDQGDPMDEVLDRERVEFLMRAIAALPERLRYIVQAYFFEERSVTEIADLLGVTQSRVSQLRTEAISLLRDGLDAQFDPERLRPLRTRANGSTTHRRAVYRAALKDGTAG